MAFDKLVDSSQLDGAMTYTAEAIREKTGDSAQITWDLTYGFKSAVEAISGGGDTGGYAVIEIDENGFLVLPSDGGGITLSQDANGNVILPSENGNVIIKIALIITENGTYTAPSGFVYNRVIVNVAS